MEDIIILEAAQALVEEDQQENKTSDLTPSKFMQVLKKLESDKYKQKTEKALKDLEQGNINTLKKVIQEVVKDELGIDTDRSIIDKIVASVKKVYNKLKNDENVTIPVIKKQMSTRTIAAILLAMAAGITVIAITKNPKCLINPKEFVRTIANMSTAKKAAAIVAYEIYLLAVAYVGYRAVKAIYNAIKQSLSKVE